MTVDKTIEAILAIPRAMESVDTVSLSSLLRDSGYFENYPLVTEGALYVALLRHPPSVRAWIQFSADQRSSEGWSIRKSGLAYEVEHFPRGTSTPYSDELGACAGFIKRTIEEVRTAHP